MSARPSANSTSRTPTTVTCVDHGTAKALARLQAHGVMGKTGTAEVSEAGNNNAWFAGYVPATAGAEVQLCFCAVVYFVRDGEHECAVDAA